MLKGSRAIVAAAGDPSIELTGQLVDAIVCKREGYGSGDKLGLPKGSSFERSYVTILIKPMRVLVCEGKKSFSSGSI